LTISNTVSAGQDILLAAGGTGSLFINQTSTAGRNQSLLARAGITQTANVFANGGTLDVEAFNGSYTMTSGTSGIATGDIRVKVAQDITVSLLSTGSNASLESVSGSIIDGQGDTVINEADDLTTDDLLDKEPFATQTGAIRTVNLVANGLALKAGGSIGATGNPLDTSVATIAAEAGNSVFLYETDAVDVGDVTSTVERVGLDSSLTAKSLNVVGGTATAAQFMLETINGNLSTSNAITAGQDVLLAAGGTDKNLTVNANITAEDDIGLRAKNNLTISSGVIVKSNDTKDIPASNKGSVDIEAFDGNVVLSNSTVQTENGNIRVAARSAGKTLTLGDLITKSQVYLLADGAIATSIVVVGEPTVVGSITAKGAIVQSISGGIDIKTNVDTLTVKAKESITVREFDGIQLLGKAAIDGIDRLGLDNTEWQLQGITSIGANVAVETDSMFDLTANGNITNAVSAIIDVKGLATFNAGQQAVFAAGVKDIKLGDQDGDKIMFGSLRIAGGGNVSVTEDTNREDANTVDDGTLISGANHFDGDFMVIEADGSLDFAESGASLTAKEKFGPDAKMPVAVFIADTVGGLPGESEFNSDLKLDPRLPNAGSGNAIRDESAVTNFDIDFNVTNPPNFTPIVVSVSNTLRSPNNANGSFISPIHSKQDPVSKLIFNFSFDDSLAQIHEGTTTIFGDLSGDTAVFFSSAPIIDFAIGDVAEQARNFLRKGVNPTVANVGKIGASIDRASVAKSDGLAEYAGPFWTIGYDYDLYDLNKETVPGLPFPLYYLYNGDVLENPKSSVNLLE
jgi:hypothetical protein